MKLSRSFILFIAMCLIWGTTWIALKAGIAAVPVVLFGATRFTAAGALLLGFFLVGGGTARVRRGDLPRLAAATTLTTVIPHPVMLWGMLHVSSGLAAVINLSCIPVALLAIGIALREETFSVQRAAAIAVGLVGLAILFGPKAIGSVTGGAMELWGAAAILASALLYSCGSVLTRPLLRSYPPALIASLTMLGGGTLMMAGALVLEPGAAQAATGQWGARAWAGWAFLVLFGSVVAFTIYLQLLRDWGASRAGTYCFVSPLVAVLTGVAVLGEEIRLTDAAGMAVMLGSAWLALTPQARALPEPSARAAPAE